MRGYYPQPDPNQYAADKWLGKRVNRNGSDDYGTVLRAYWGGPGQPTKLSVGWDTQSLSLSALTDSEHVTIVRNENA